MLKGSYSTVWVVRFWQSEAINVINTYSPTKGFINTYTYAYTYTHANCINTFTITNRGALFTPATPKRLWLSEARANTAAGPKYPDSRFFSGNTAPCKVTSLKVTLCNVTPVMPP